MAGPVRLEAGELFAQEYRVQRELGAGAMGVVYAVEQLRTGAQRALKVMHPALLAEADMQRRFQQEARIAARIDSDHIVQVIDAGIEGALKVPWIVMEYLEGQDLATASANQQIHPDTVPELLEQLCHGLAAAHRAGVVHRDLKPENIYLAASRRSDARFTVKILDFGVAKLVTRARTTSTKQIGTPLWMAPEQADPKPRIGPWTDVWALGLIAFWLYTGQHYWLAAQHPNASLQALLREILFGERVLASERALQLDSEGTLPSGFDSWFARCVTQPHERFVDAGEAWERLAAFLKADPASTPPDTVASVGSVESSIEPRLPQPPVNPAHRTSNSFVFAVVRALKAQPSVLKRVPARAKLIAGGTAIAATTIATVFLCSAPDAGEVVAGADAVASTEEEATPQIAALRAAPAATPEHTEHSPLASGVPEAAVATADAGGSTAAQRKNLGTVVIACNCDVAVDTVPVGAQEVVGVSAGRHKFVIVDKADRTHREVRELTVKAGERLELTFSESKAAKPRVTPVPQKQQAAPGRRSASDGSWRKNPGF